MYTYFCQKNPMEDPVNTFCQKSFCTFSVQYTSVIDDSFNPVVEETHALILLYLQVLLQTYLYGNNTIFLQEAS
jgi:hypothetical protein